MIILCCSFVLCVCVCFMLLSYFLLLLLMLFLLNWRERERKRGNSGNRNTNVCNLSLFFFFLFFFLSSKFSHAWHHVTAWLYVVHVYFKCVLCFLQSSMWYGVCRERTMSVEWNSIVREITSAAASGYLLEVVTSHTPRIWSRKCARPSTTRNAEPFCQAYHLVIIIIMIILSFSFV